jgi:acyl-CoA dehydrogenase
LPEASNGSGGTWLDAHVVLVEAGRVSLPLPIAETMVGAWLLAQAGLEVPAGPLAIALDSGLSLQGGKLAGEALAVAWGADAAHVVAIADGQVALVAGKAAQAAKAFNLAGEPRDTLAWKDAPVIASARLDGVNALALGALARSAQMAGAIERVLEISVRYVIERSQFGRPLAANQAVQQALAVLAGHAAAATMAAEHAFHAMHATQSKDAEFDIAAAKVRCGEAASMAANLAHQAHGAIGFTREHALQYATRRLWSWRAEYGAESHWAAWLGRRVALRGADAFWEDLVAR